MTLSRNPTKTLKIEKAWRREINRRFSLLSASIQSELKRVNDQALLTNKELGFDASQLRVYMAFLESEINRLVLVSDGGQNWQGEYQIQSYMRAIDQARASLISQGVDISPTVQELQQAAGLTQFTATPSLGSATLAPIHQDALEFLFTRSYESLEGWTSAFTREVRQILFQGVQTGAGIAEVSRQIRERTKVARSRAQLIARTETIQAYQLATARESQRVSDETGEEVLIRWITRVDDRVRHLHAGWHGELMTHKEYAKRIQISPFNCRCGSAPVVAEANTKRKQEKFDEEKRILMSRDARRS